MAKGDKMRMSRKSNRKRVKDLQARLAAMKAELHDLNTGQTALVFDQANRG